MPAMQTLADATQLEHWLEHLAGAIADRMQAEPEAGWALVGLRRRGDQLAHRLAERLDADRLQQRVGSLDITLYRDDLAEVGPQAVVRTTDVPFALDRLNVVLVDDVLMTGRSVRAALSSLMDLGRPKRVWLAVLVDRGGRELPIAPDFVGLDLRETRSDELTLPAPEDRVAVQLTPEDETDAIVIETATSNANA